MREDDPELYQIDGNLKESIRDISAKVSEYHSQEVMYVTWLVN